VTGIDLIAVSLDEPAVPGARGSTGQNQPTLFRDVGEEVGTENAG
jgi:hypothetical protein